MEPAAAPENARYRAEIEALYLGLRNRGLMVSPADAATIAGWEREAIPLELVLQTVRRLLSPLARKRVPPLRYCDAALREAWALRQGQRRVQRAQAVAAPARSVEVTGAAEVRPRRPGPDTLAATALSASRALRQAGARLPASHVLRQAYDGTSQALVRLARRASAGEVDTPDGYRELARMDAHLCRTFLRWLPTPERQRLQASATAEARRRDRGRGSSNALGRLRRELLARALEEKGLCRILGLQGARLPEGGAEDDQ